MWLVLESPEELRDYARACRNAAGFACRRRHDELLLMADETERLADHTEALLDLLRPTPQV